MEEIINQELENQQEPVEVNETPSNETEASEQATETEEQRLTKQLEEQKDKFLRLFAEFDNYKKRTAKERIELFSTAGKEILLEMIPVMDDLDRAVAAAANTEDIQAVREGLNLIADKMKKALEKKGVRAIECKGELFDVEKHEAITEIPAPTEDLKGKVVDDIEKGYTLYDKILRFSKVVVGK